MKKVKWNEIDQLEEQLINEFLEERKDWEAFNTEDDIDIINNNNESIDIYVNSYGDWEYVESYLIEE